MCWGKNREGSLKSPASRREFLSDPSHRIRFVYLPKHSSWLNQIEVIFGIVMRKVMRRGNFPSVSDLEAKLRAFLRYFNQTLARLVKRAGVPRLTTHGLRHTAATHMVRYAADLGEVRAAADILGHSPEMLMHTYSHALPESIKTVTAKIGERHRRLG